MVYCIQQLNNELMLSYTLHFSQFILLILAFHMKTFLINLPLIIIRTQRFMTNSVKLTPQMFEMPVFWYGTTYRQWLTVRLILLFVSAAYHFWRLSKVF